MGFSLKNLKKAIIDEDKKTQQDLLFWYRSPAIESQLTKLPRFDAKLPTNQNLFHAASAYLNLMNEKHLAPYFSKVTKGCLENPECEKPYKKYFKTLLTAVEISHVKMSHSNWRKEYALRLESLEQP